MSSALAIAGVTHVLRELLKEGLVNAGITSILGTTADVTAQPPDRLAAATAEGGGEITALNLFLHRASPNLGWRNEGLPSRDASGRARLSNPPLALDLHYILSAHAPGYLHAEILLGHAMLVLHDNGIVPRLSIRAALQSSVSTPPLDKLAGSGLDEQVEQLKITPEHLGSEELSKFWTAAQSHYRPSAGYQVSVVLIQASAPVRGPLPVLERRGHVRPELGLPFPTLEAVVSADGQPSATLGTKIFLQGHDLGSGTRTLVLLNERFVLELTRQETGPSNPTRVELTIDDSEGLEFPVGVYRVSARLGTGPGTVATNQLALVLAPKITAVTPPSPITRDPITSNASLTVSFLPPLRPGQVARLVLGQRECVPDDFTGAVTSLTFTIPNAPLGTHQLRLRVDGIDSAILDLSDPAPAFNDQKLEILP